MKKALSLILICLTLAGCSVKDPEPTPPTPEPAPSVESTTEIPTQAQTAPPADTQAPTTAAMLTYTIYLPDGNAEGFVTAQAETEVINADSVLAELQAQGVLTENVIINAFGSKGDQLNIDFNTAFADLVNSTGTSGERMIIGSVVNTFLSAFQAQSVFFTVEGEILESGHVVYDFPITFVE